MGIRLIPINRPHPVGAPLVGAKPLTLDWALLAFNNSTVINNGTIVYFYCPAKFNSVFGDMLDSNYFLLTPDKGWCM